MNFNKIIDMLFNETTINQNIISEEIPKSSMKAYFYSILQEFKPEETLKIFDNTNTNNTSLILLYKENVQSILQDKQIKPFIDSLIEMINEPEILMLNYSITKFIINTNSSNYQSLYSNAFKQIIFYPKLEYIGLALELIENITNRIFKCIENNQYFFCELYTPEYFVEEILKDKNKDINLHIPQMMIIYFIYQYHINLNIFREKFIMLFDNPNGNAQAISNAKDTFNKIVYYQENFYSHFCFINLYNEMFINNKVDISKLENAIILITSSIGQFFPKYRLFKMKKLIFQEYLTDENQLYKLEEILKRMRVNVTQNWSNWFDLFYCNPYLIAIGTLNYFGIGFCKSDSYNYYEIAELYENFKFKFDLHNTDNVKAIEIFVKCLIVVSVMFNSDMKKYSFILGEDQLKTQSSIIQFNSNVIILLWKIKTEITNDQYNLIKGDIYKLINDIVYYKESCLLNIVTNRTVFDETLIQYIIESIECSHMCSKYFNDCFSTKDIDKILNGFLLFGHWANKYPIKYIYTRLLDVLYIFKNTIDLRTVFINEENINKLIKGIYLLFKAFPHANEEFVQFINYIRNNVTSWINDYSVLNYAIQSIDKVYRFVTHEILNTSYNNKHTGLIDLKSI